MNEIIHTILCGNPATVQITLDDEGYKTASLSDDYELINSLDNGTVVLVKAMIMVYKADFRRWYFDSCMDMIEVEKGEKREMITDVMEQLRIDNVSN